MCAYYVEYGISCHSVGGRLKLYNLKIHVYVYTCIYLAGKSPQHQPGSPQPGGQSSRHGGHSRQASQSSLGSISSTELYNDIGKKSHIHCSCMYITIEPSMVYVRGWGSPVFNLCLSKLSRFLSIYGWNMFCNIKWKIYKMFFFL